MYRSAPYLPELFRALQSLQPAPREILFLDDASPDESYALAAAFLARYTGKSSLRLLRNERNLGIAGSYNRLVQEGQSHWMQVLDGDDRPLSADYYAEVEQILHTGDCELVVTGVDSNAASIHWGNRLFARFVPRHTPRWWPLLGSFATRSGVIYRREALLNTPFYDPAFPGSDVLHFLQLRKSGSCRYVRRARLFYRVHQGAASSATPDYSRYRAELDRLGGLVGFTHRLDLRVRRIGQSVSR